MKQRKSVAQLLAGHPFLAGTKPSVRKLFCDCAAIEWFNEGQRLFCEGGPAEQFYLINNGQVLLEVAVPGGHPLTIQAIGPGEALGWSWLFPPYEWRFTATAVRPTEAVVFDAKALREQAQLHHKFCYELVLRLAGVLAGRLEDLRTRLLYALQERRKS